jgi:3-dehydroquinate dehydratase
MPKFSPKTIEGLPEAIQKNLDVDAAQDAVDVVTNMRLDYLETLSDAINQRLDALEAVHLEGSLLITYRRVDERKTTS